MTLGFKHQLLPKTEGFDICYALNTSMPASVHCTVVNAFKATINLQPLRPGHSWNLNPSIIRGLQVFISVPYAPRTAAREEFEVRNLHRDRHWMALPLANTCVFRVIPTICRYDYWRFSRLSWGTPDHLKFCHHHVCLVFCSSYLLTIVRLYTHSCRQRQ
jgi:hypothetical protein